MKITPSSMGVSDAAGCYVSLLSLRIRFPAPQLGGEARMTVLESQHSTFQGRLKVKKQLLCVMHS